MAKMGRPQIQIDEEMFKGLCRIQCTLNEIADFFNCSEDTIERWCKRTFKQTFADAFKKYGVAGKISLRRTQFKMAEHNVTMAIWLGKQYLGQKDVIEQVGDDTSIEILKDIEAEIKKAKEHERTKQTGSNTLSS